MQSKVSKNDWIAMFQEIGISGDTMMRWHNLFEKRHPEAHEEFLAWLGISSDERAKIRSN